ncbi:MAG: choice-of-anchor Q domain-containing protein [Bacteroidota bacterium]
MRTLITLLLVFLFCSAQKANATIRTFQFSGVTISPPGAIAGKPMVATLVFDDASAPTAAGNGFAIYNFISFVITVDGNTYTASSGYIQIVTTQGFGAQSKFDVSANGGLLQLSLLNPAAQVLPNTNLPATINLSDFPQTYGGVITNGSSYQYYSPISSFVNLTPACPPNSGNTAYVNSAVAGSGDGGSWATAFKTMQEALAAANTCSNISQIWVAKGTYLPDQGGSFADNDRNAAFTMKNNLAIYGGFDGTETLLSQRNPVTNTTILSGDLNNDDGPNFTNRSDNSYHVVSNFQNGLNNTAILDGFTVSGGYADNNIAPYLGGGGMLNYSSSPAVNNCIFSGNSTTLSGGGMSNTSSLAVITNCSFIANSGNNGGGVYSFGGIAVFTGCSFIGNISNSSGAMANNFVNATVTNCSFSGNSANYGAAMYNQGSNTVIVTNCSFTSNTASNSGGAINSFDGNITVTKCTFSGNTASNTGGAIGDLSAVTSVTNCIFTGNTAGSYGGAIYTPNLVHVLNCSFSGNSAPSSGALYLYLGTVKNSIVWGNSSGLTFIYLPSSSVTNSIIQGGCPGAVTCSNVLNVDPLFVQQPPVGLGIAGDLHLQAGSPAINAGTNTGAPATDIEGNIRLLTVANPADMGAYEAVCVISVTAPTVTQPTCTTPTGTIVVNATGEGTLEYSIDNGANWQTDGTFSGLTPGNYTIKAHIQASPTCEAAYSGNPVVLASPFTVTATDTWTGCVSTDWAIAGNWQDGTVPTATDNVTIPNVTNDPIINNGAVAKSVIVQSGSVLMVAVAGQLSINGATGYGLHNFGTVDNSGTIQTGLTTITGLEGMFNAGGSTFNNKPGGALLIDRTAAGDQAFYSAGTVNNQGTIKIGSIAPVVRIGIAIGGGSIFNNKPGGIVQVDNTGSTAIRVLNNGTVVNNEARIDIGSSSDVRGIGVRNEAGSTFNNKAGGDIYINRVGIYNTTVLGAIRNSGAFVNDAKITIGNGVLLYAQDGILNVGGSFINNASGDISIEKPWGNGIWHSTGNFQNAGKIRIRNVFYFEDGDFSTGILSTAPFTNAAGAEIHIDQVATGIATTNAFSNAGLIRMGENAPLAGSGIANIQGANAVFNNNSGGDISIRQAAAKGVQNDANSTFNNNACARLTIYDSLSNNGLFTNAGLFTVNTAEAHINTALTNNGIIAYPQGNPIPNVTNNKMIVAPISTLCGPITPALEIGANNDLIAGTTWYQNPELTTVAGTYSPNIFDPSNLATGPHMLYFSVEDPGNGCTRTISISVTVNGTAGDWYKDEDHDGYSNGTMVTACDQPAGYRPASELTATSGDCNDDPNAGGAAINPAATEICGDGIDNNCNGSVDEGCIVVCPQGHGHWKNNPDSWPASGLPMMLGTISYTKAQLLVILKTPVGSGNKADASIILAYQLIAAKLNIANGATASQPVLNAIAAADAAIAGNAIPMGTRTNTTLGKTMTSLAATLEQYNSGLLNIDCYTAPAIAVNIIETGTIIDRPTAQNYPNPFSEVTTIRYTLVADGPVSLAVYNELGQRVATLATGRQLAGTHQVTFNAAKPGAGIYRYSLQTVDTNGKPITLSGKMVVTK